MNLHATKITLFFLCFIFYIINANSQPLFQLSQNVYRIPYENGKTMEVRQDQYTHSPLGRFDLRAEGKDDCSSHRIASAAAGVVEMVVENNSQSCTTCGASNNYVWIRHANDEWSKYTHFAQNSVTVNVGDTVCAGTILGYECWIGSTSPAEFRHLHWEVRRPTNPAAPVIDPAGGFMDSLDGLHLIPVINSFSNHYLEKGDILTASGSSSCINSNITIPGRTIADRGIKIYMASGTIVTNTNSVIFSNGANGLFHAGADITLSPGFKANAGSYFQARIGGCGTTPFPGGCN